jgi:hypothetical protein
VMEEEIEEEEMEWNVFISRNMNNAYHTNRTFVHLREIDNDKLHK